MRFRSRSRRGGNPACMRLQAESTRPGLAGANPCPGWGHPHLLLLALHRRRQQLRRGLLLRCRLRGHLALHRLEQLSVHERDVPHKLLVHAAHLLCHGGRHRRILRTRRRGSSGHRQGGGQLGGRRQLASFLLGSRGSGLRRRCRCCLWQRCCNHSRLLRHKLRLQQPAWDCGRLLSWRRGGAAAATFAGRCCWGAAPGGGAAAACRQEQVRGREQAGRRLHARFRRGSCCCRCRGCRLCRCGGLLREPLLLGGCGRGAGALLRGHLSRLALQQGGRAQDSGAAPSADLPMPGLAGGGPQ